MTCPVACMTLLGLKLASDRVMVPTVVCHCRHSLPWLLAPSLTTEGVTSLHELFPTLPPLFCAMLEPCCAVCVLDGLVCACRGLAKTILQGTVKGGRRQGRQKKRWEGYIRKWTGLEFGRSQRAVENREKWRKLVAKSSVVPQRPSRLRDR